MNHEVWCDYCGEDKRKNWNCCTAATINDRQTHNEEWAIKEASNRVLKEHLAEVKKLAQKLFNDVENQRLHNSKELVMMDATWKIELKR
jgi:hypothetical protein